MHAELRHRLWRFGDALPKAIKHAKKYLTGALKAQLNLGHGFARWILLEVSLSPTGSPLSRGAK